MARGTFDGTAWQLVRAPATSGGTCWRLDGEGEIELDAIAATEIDGATCLLPIDPAVDEPVQIVFDTGSTAPFDAIVAVLPAGSQARLLFVDRSREDVPVDPQGFLVWVGPKEPMAVVLQVTGPDRHAIGVRARFGEQPRGSGSPGAGSGGGAARRAVALSACVMLCSVSPDRAVAPGLAPRWCRS